MVLGTGWLAVHDLLETIQAQKKHTAGLLEGLASGVQLDVIPPRTVTGPWVAEELIKWMSWVGILREKVTDQGNNFMFHVLRSVCQVLKVNTFKLQFYIPKLMG